MKKLLALGFLVPLFLVACGVSQDKYDALKKDNDELKAQVAALKEEAGPPPASLDNLFPPKAPAPVWLLQMFDLSAPLGGMMVDLMEQDFPNAQANYEKFKAEYVKASKLVPEWTKNFPMEPVNALGEALKAGKPDAVQGAAMKLGEEVCGRCHLANQAKVRQKYHWPDFSKAMVKDPVSGQSQPWGQFMFSMEMALSGISNDLGQGQLDNARKNFQAFNAQFGALRQGCDNCHKTPRAYFVDKSVQDLIDQLGKELQASAPNPQNIGQLFQGIGNNSCFNCHMVHMDSAQAKMRWELMK